MNNQELQNKLDSILRMENFFDMVEALFDFEKEYKSSAFYKKTRMSFLRMIKMRKQFMGFDYDDALEKIQEKINELDLSHLNSLFDQIGDVFGQENSAVLESIKEIQKLREE